MAAQIDARIKLVLALLALLQGLLTALAAASGGLSSTILNETDQFLIGLAVVLAGFLFTFWASLREESHPGSVLVLLGLGLILAGICGTAYVALAVPRIASSPTVNVEIASTKPLIVRSRIEASGIKRSTTFQIQVAGFVESDKNVFSEPEHALLYHALLGADASGVVSSTLEVPVPVGRYDAVGVDAWTGDGASPGACGYIPGKPAIGFESNRHHLGCALVRLTGPLGRTTHSGTSLSRPDAGSPLPQRVQYVR